MFLVLEFLCVEAQETDPQLCHRLTVLTEARPSFGLKSSHKTLKHSQVPEIKKIFFYRFMKNSWFQKR